MAVWRGYRTFGRWTPTGENISQGWPLRVCSLTPSCLCSTFRCVGENVISQQELLLPCLTCHDVLHSSRFLGQNKLRPFYYNRYWKQESKVVTLKNLAMLVLRGMRKALEHWPRKALNVVIRAYLATLVGAWKIVMPRALWTVESQIMRFQKGTRTLISN